MSRTTTKTVTLNHQIELDNKHSVPFAFEELFFSRTDERGIIISGNSVFQRISLYEWNEILNKPHNLIRHPDMPKAVFWLLWDTIKRGEPIGAYVKNRAKDGRYYWVFAVVTPFEGGYLSVRLKPSSPILGIVEQEYKKLVALESTQKISSKDSGEILLNRIKELGFLDYNDFMSEALSAEVQARNSSLARKENRTNKIFDEISTASKQLLTQANNILTVYEKNSYVPLNLRIQAAQLERDGETIGVISRNYNIISNDIKTELSKFMKSAFEVSKTINNSRFLLNTAQIQKEVIEFFKDEELDESISKNTEMDFLETQRGNYFEKAIKSFHSISNQTESFKKIATP